MSSATIYTGDCRAVLRTLEAGAVQCVVTSPPYFGLRDYGVPGQLGLEDTPDDLVAALIEVFREVRRVLRDDGVLWLNVGDSYSHGGNGSRDPERWPKQSRNGGGFRSRHSKKQTGLKPKDLIGFPWMLAFALRADGWWLRSDVIWAKPNPMPESVRDRPTVAHEHVFLLAKSERYFYDAEAVRKPAKVAAAAAKVPAGWDTEPGRHGTIHRNGRKSDKQRGHSRRRDGFNDRWDAMPEAEQQAMGANLRSVWTIAPEPYRGEHFATFPTKLVEPCILAGTSQAGQCPACGAPWRRVVDVAYENPGNRQTNGDRSVERRHLEHGSAGYAVRMERRSTTTGWEPTCECDAGDPVPQVVLDPFSGTGRTGITALRLGRRYIGIELKPETAVESVANIRNDAPLLNEVELVT